MFICKRRAAGSGTEGATSTVYVDVSADVSNVKAAIGRGTGAWWCGQLVVKSCLFADSARQLQSELSTVML
jgi:hypothetical protein